MFFRIIRRLAAAMVLVAGSHAATAQEAILSGGPYVPTPQRVVEAMLGLAGVTDRDYVIDLGSGDGRIVIAAAQKFGARGKGYDIDDELVQRSNTTARKLNLQQRILFEQQDVLKADIREATVVTLYLLPDMMNALRGKLRRELRPGTRIVSHDFDFGDWKPDRVISLDLDEKYEVTGSWSSTIYLWTVPSRAAQ